MPGFFDIHFHVVITRVMESLYEIALNPWYIHINMKKLFPNSGNQFFDQFSDIVRRGKWEF